MLRQDIDYEFADDEEYEDVEQRLVRVYNVYEQLRAKKNDHRNSLQDVYAKLCKSLPRDVIQYVIAPFVSEWDFLESALGVKVSVDTAPLAYFQPYDLPPIPRELMWEEVDEEEDTEDYLQAQRVWRKYESYFHDDQVTDKRNLFCRMFRVSLSSIAPLFTSHQAYLTRACFSNDEDWWKHQKRVCDVWTWFYLLLDPTGEWTTADWDWLIMDLCWTYTLDGVEQPTVFRMDEMVRNARTFIWIPVVDDKKPHRIQLTLRQLTNVVCTSPVFCV